MNGPEAHREQLLRLLDGRASAGERQRLEELLRTDPALRDFLREVAEQSVVVADRERQLVAREIVQSPRPAPVRHRERAWRPWAWGLAGAVATATMVLGAGWASGWLRPARPVVARVTRVTGASQVFGSPGRVDYALQPGDPVRPGDTLETGSCDSWVELELREGTRVTLAGHSALRVLETDRQRTRLSLIRGNLWGDAASPRSGPRLAIQTPSATVEAGAAQFDLQAGLSSTTLRVNQGSAVLGRVTDGQTIEVQPGNQAEAQLNPAVPLAAVPQPRPVASWSAEPGRLPEVVLGQWLSPTVASPHRLGSVPLLWPLPNRDPITLYVVGISVRRSSDRPVQFSPEATVVFRGRTTSPHPVRFGFSTQKMQGVFAGKFEVDVPPASLGPVGEPWIVQLPLSAFRPLQPQLSPAPAGLELNDLYALTVGQDAGLEIHEFRVEPGPPEPR